MKSTGTPLNIHEMTTRVLQHIDSSIMRNAVISLGILLLFLFISWVIKLIIRRNVHDIKRSYYWRRLVRYATGFFIILTIGSLWLKESTSIATFVGLLSAGLAVAMKDMVSNIAAWIFIIVKRPFKPGDRIQIGDAAGDVVDIRLFQFSILEIGNWVDADQSTGRILHIPNYTIFREKLGNYQAGFDYIWHEIPVLITFESNWKQAREILNSIAWEHLAHLAEGAHEQIRDTARSKYFVVFNKLTPIVYTSIKNSGVLLTVRYIVNPRQRRGSENTFWEAVLSAFSGHNDIDFAYPTTRFYTAKTSSHSAPAEGQKPDSYTTKR